MYTTFSMSRVGVLFPVRSAKFLVDNPHQLPHEQRMTPAQRVTQGKANRLSVMGRPTRDRSIITPDEKYAMHVMGMPKRIQSELEYKQPALIRIPFGVSQNGFVDKVADKALFKQFMTDRAATTGRINSKQIIARGELTQRSLQDERVPDLLSFQNAPTIVRAQQTARHEANLFNSQFEAAPVRQFTAPLRSR